MALPLIPLAIGGGALLLLLTRKKGAALAGPPPPGSPPSFVLQGGGGIVLPPTPPPQQNPVPHIVPNTILVPPNTILPSLVPGVSVLVNPTNPSGTPLLGTVATKSTGVTGELYVHSATDTTVASRIGTLAHGETIKILGTAIDASGNGQWDHVQKLDGSLDGFVDALYIAIVPSN
jgi:hypothetical protein